MNLISTGDLRYSATDLSHYINCRHLTLLNKEVAYGRLDRPPITDPYFHMLTERGRRFEDKYLDFLRSSGWKLSFTGKSGDEKPSFERTLELMKSGAEIIVQARLEFDEWMGFADILRKINKKSRWGDWAYEVMDTKLARETKAGSVMQLCVYTDLLNSIQDYEPEYMYIVKPEPDGTGFVEERHRFRDYGAYFRRIRKQFLKDIASHEISDSYPDPVAYCEQCNWWIRCEKERRKDDHLVYVARMSKMHMAELHEREIKKLGQFATSPVIDWRPKRGNKTSYQRLQEQAKIQLKGRSEQRPVFEFLPMDEDFGLARLPEPDPGDVFFDIESDRYVEGGGLEYLLGFVYRDASGEFVYDRFWSNDHREEKQNFERLMDWLTVRWATYPGMYIYHFAPYEPAALKRLMTRHNSKVDELDRLLRANSFVDLHTIVRRSVRASVESYSLKDLEPFYGFERETDLKKAAWSLRAFQRNLEFGISDPLPDDTIQNIDNYNREDCLSTWRLRNWLEQLRGELKGNGYDLERPEIEEGAPNAGVEDAESRIERLMASLSMSLDPDDSKWSKKDKAKWILANLLGYFRREKKCDWWDYFRIRDLDEDDLSEERHAIAGLQYIGRVGGKDSNPIHKYSFPFQEVSLKESDTLFDLADQGIGKISSIDIAKQTVEISKSQKAKDNHPRNVFSNDRTPIKVLENALLGIAEGIEENGFDRTRISGPVIDLLLKQSPDLSERQPGRLRNPGESSLEAAIRLSRSLNSSLLAIQGPPGSGKTYVGARVILKLLEAGNKIGVTALSHKAIRNMLDEILKAADENKITVKVVQRVKKKSIKEEIGFQEVTDDDKALNALDEGCVVGGTVWFWAHDLAENCLDYLIVDEAGQLSLAHVLTACRSTRNLILLGDPQQLEQPQQAAHPEGTNISALEHLLDGHQTIPDDKGLFLDQTYRMHPDICAFNSELYYENRLKSVSGLGQQKIKGNHILTGSGLFYLPVSHRGNSNTSPEEAEKIQNLVSGIMSSGSRWVDKFGDEHLLTPADIMIIAPYNAQVSAISNLLPEYRVGTVDKFQGQEAPIVIYSVTSSSSEDAPRGMGFLYRPNRLNVASSRAKCAFIMVASPAIFEADCQKPEQMRWANGFCRFLEMAEVVE